MNKSEENFDGLDHQYTPEECLHQTDTHMIFTIGNNFSTMESSFNQGHNTKRDYIQCSLSGIAWSSFLWLHESYKNDRPFLYLFPKKSFESRKNAYYLQVEARAWTKNETENVRHYALKVRKSLKKNVALNLQQLITTIVMKLSLEVYQRTERFSSWRAYQTHIYGYGTLQSISWAR